MIVRICTRLFGKKKVSDFYKKFSLMSRNFSNYVHKVQKNYDWKVEPQPEWFDHYCDQHFQFSSFGSPLFVERGTFGLLAIKQGSDILEVCCGDGYNARHFYASRANRIISVDFDHEALEHAKKFNQVKNVEFRFCDIRDGIPEGKFDNVIWDTAIEHFTEEEIAKIMSDIKSRLKDNGILLGSTIVELPSGDKSLSHHEREFVSKEDLRSFFEPHFKNVKVFETIHPSEHEAYPSRHNLYFYASDSVLPFDENWENVSQKRG